MLGVTPQEQQLLDITRREPRFSLAAYEFVTDAVTYASHVVYATGTHVTGGELLEAIRRLGRERYGVLARDVFESWGVRTTEDFGTIVFLLVGDGLLGKTENDSIEDFRGVFSFEDAFRESDYWQDRIDDGA